MPKSPLGQTPLSRRTLIANSARSGAVLAASTLGVPQLAFGRHRLFQESEDRYSTRTVDLVGDSLVIDMLSPLTLASSMMQSWYGNPSNIPESFWEDLKRSGIDAVLDAVGTGAVGARESVLMRVAAVNGLVAHNGHRMLRVERVADLDEANRGERVGMIFGVQNSDHFETLDDVNTFYGLGQRVSQLTYNERNRIGTGSTDRIDGGLSDYGVAVIERMNEVGMAVDVSHCGDRTSLDAFEASRQPVLVTHSNVRTLADGHVRCKPDEVIDAVGRAGSVFGVTGVRMFVKASEPTTVEHLLDHFDYLVRRIGAEHVGIGSDIDLYGYDDMPEEDMTRLRSFYTKGKYHFRDQIDIPEVAHPKRVFDLTEGLVRRGYTDPDIRGILGGNFRRVLEEIWG